MKNCNILFSFWLESFIKTPLAGLHLKANFPNKALFSKNTYFHKGAFYFQK